MMTCHCYTSLYLTLIILHTSYFMLVMTAESQEKSIVQCTTTKGPLLIEVNHAWSPLGAKRFMDLVRDGFYKNIAFFRCVEKFLTQFGISENPAMKHWHNDQIKDDPNLHLGIKKHYVSFAGGGPNTRSTQIFIAFEDLNFLGKEPWETPFGVVTSGEDTLNKLYKGYGDIPPFGKGPNQNKIHNRGNDYIHKEFPLVDFLENCSEVSSSQHHSVPIIPIGLEHHMHDSNHLFNPKESKLIGNEEIRQKMRSHMEELMMKRNKIEASEEVRKEEEKIQQGDTLDEVDADEGNVNEIPREEDDDDEEEEGLFLDAAVTKDTDMSKTKTRKGLKRTTGTVLPLYYALLLVVGMAIVCVYRKYVFKETPVNKRI